MHTHDHTYAHICAKGKTVMCTKMKRKYIYIKVAKFTCHVNVGIGLLLGVVPFVDGGTKNNKICNNNQVSAKGC